jgi:hypothetical protein
VRGAWRESESGREAIVGRRGAGDQRRAGGVRWRPGAGGTCFA